MPEPTIPTGAQLPIDPENPPLPPPIAPENDPNLAMQNLIARRKKKDEPAPEPTKPEPIAPPKDNTKSNAAASEVISKALGFRPKLAGKPADEPKPDSALEKSGEKDGAPPDKEPGKTDPPPADPAKTIVSKKKAAPVIDPVRIASEAATAATREAMRSVKPISSLIKDDKIEDTFSDEERHTYEVAKHLSDTNPKYKGAEKIVADHVRKASRYSQQWESKNPGKQFNPDDEEHNEFYAGLEKPWAEHEFRKAESQLATAEQSKGDKEPLLNEIHELKRAHAELELAPIVNQTHTQVAAVIARAAGDDVWGVLTKDGFDKLAETDQISAEHLDRAAAEVRPMIETIIQLDDPKNRIKADSKNPLHQEWYRFLRRVEVANTGADDGTGRTLISREEYNRLPPDQIDQHWTLTANHLVTAYAEEAAEKTSKIITAEKEKQKKIAASLGFVPRTETPKETKKSQATNTPKDETPAPPRNDTPKPVSPAAGGGVPIDGKGDGPKSGIGGLSEALSGILFRR